MCEHCDWEIYRDLAEGIAAGVERLPEKAEEFGASVAERAGDIGSTMSTMEHATDAQKTAMTNMAEGVNRWLERADEELIEIP